MRLVLAAAVVVAAALLAQRNAALRNAALRAAAGEGGDYSEGFDIADEPDQTTTLWDDAIVALTPATYTPDSTTGATAELNVRAFLDTIAYAEGTAGTDGYRTMFGYRYFDSFADHPRQYFPYTDRSGRHLRTSAAGRYQLIVKTWDTLRARLGLGDFSPSCQDAAAVELIRERGALLDVRAGRIATAVVKCAPVWASLPGAGYSQPERPMSNLLAAYTAAGGYLA